MYSLLWTLTCDNSCCLSPDVVFIHVLSIVKLSFHKNPRPENKVDSRLTAAWFIFRSINRSKINLEHTLSLHTDTPRLWGLVWKLKFCAMLFSGWHLLQKIQIIIISGHQDNFIWKKKKLIKKSISIKKNLE